MAGNEEKRPSPEENGVDDGADPTKTGGSIVSKAHYGVNKVCSFTLMDIIEDECRVRALNIWAFLLVFVFFVLAFLHIVRMAEPRPIRVLFSAAPPQSLVNGLVDPSRFMRARIIRDDGGPQGNVLVEPYVADFTPAGPVPCSFRDQQLLNDTLEAIRFESVCVYTVHGRGQTDDLGISTIDNFTINGPAGNYKMKLRAQPGTSALETGSTFSTITRSPVQTLQVYKADTLVSGNQSSWEGLRAPFSAHLGQALAEQPAVYLEGPNGEPLQGRTVIAFANPDPTWPPTGFGAMVPNYGRRGQKYARLTCDTSEPSDAEGIARFSCLGVAASTWDMVNIVFAVDGVVFFPWNDFLYSSGNLYPIQVQYLRPSTLLATEVQRVQVVQGPPGEVEEGDVFDPPVSVRMLTELGQPVAGKTCFALMDSEYGNGLLLLFRRQLNGRSKKELLGAESQASDANGEAVFTNLRFSITGNTMEGLAGFRWNANNTFTMRFICDGVESPSVSVNARSRVSSVRIQRFLKADAFVARYYAPEAQDSSDVFLAVVRAVDANGKGVAGKTIKVVATDLQGSEPSPDLIAGTTLPYLAAVERAREPTSAAGFAVVPFRVILGSGSILGTGVEQFRVFFLVDETLSVASRPLTARLQGGVNAGVCHAMGFTNFYVRAPGASWTDLTHYSVFEERPILQSGSTGFAVMQFWAGSKVLSYDPAGTGSASGNTSNASSRRLTHENVLGEPRQSSIEDLVADFHRQLQEVDEGEIVHSRRLTSASGDLTISIEQAYSSDGIPHEPDSLTMMSLVSFPDGPAPRFSDLPTLLVPYSISGPPGTHFVQAEATITIPGQQTSHCYSIIQALEIVNPIELVKVQQAKFDFAPGEPIDITVEVHGFQGAAAPANLYLATDLNAEGAIYVRWVHVPLLLQGAGGFFSWPMATPVTAPLVAPQYTIYNITPYEVGADGVGRMTVQIYMDPKLGGIFGFFALMFGSKGIFSDIAYFEIFEPPNIEVEILIEPGFAAGQTELRTQTGLPTMPVVRITSNGQPVNGLIVMCQPVKADDTASFEKLTATDAYDATGLTISQPSGFVEANGVVRNPWQGPVPSSDPMAGVAVWTQFMMFDGSGCFRFRFIVAPREHLGGDAMLQAERLVPQNPLCFREAVTYSFGSMPPSTLPLGQSLEDITGTLATFTVLMAYPEGVTQIFPEWWQNISIPTAFPALAYLRISVPRYETADGEKWLNQNQGGAKTNELMGQTVCLFANGHEYNQRCTDMEWVQQSPYPIISTRVRKLAWMRVTEPATKINLVATDLSLSPYRHLDTEIAMPTGMPDMPLEEQSAICVESLAQAEAPMPISTLIHPEILPVTASLELPPPSTVMVGAMFLVRVKLLTQSGGPVRNSVLQTAIVPTLAVAGNTAGSSFLEQVGSRGNTLEAFVQPNVLLDQDGILKRSTADGIVSFPLSILQAKSGSYMLKFQSDSPSAQVLLTSPPFTVINPIDEVRATEDDWGSIEVDSFGEPVRIPRQLSFQVITSGNDTLEDLVDNGVNVRLDLSLESLSPSLQRQLQQMNKAREEAASLAESSARTHGAQVADRVTDAMGEGLVAQSLASAVGTVHNPFAMLSPELRDACRKTGVGSLESSLNMTGVRPATISEALSENPGVLPSAEKFGQFVRTATGGGSDMVSSAGMREQLRVTISTANLALLSRTPTGDGRLACVYEVKSGIDYTFSEGYTYAWKVSINGVSSDTFPDFAVTAPMPTYVERVWNWMVSSMAVLLAVCVLVTNTTKHRWQWFALAIPATIGVSIYVPFMADSGRALDGYWPVVALCNLVLIFLNLVWGLAIELRQRMKGQPKLGSLWLTFAARKKEVCETYTMRRFPKAIAGRSTDEPNPSSLPLKMQVKQMFKLFSAETAFFFPSQLWGALVLGLFAYVYALIMFINIMGMVETGIDGVLNKTIDAVQRFIFQMEGSYTLATGAELPSDATAYMYDQLWLLKGWFRSLQRSINVGFYFGICLAAVCTIVGLVGTFIHFRWVVLHMRRGIYKVSPKHGLIVRDCQMLGCLLASALVGFASIVVVVVVVTLIVSWTLMWELIWSYRHIIIGTLLGPSLFNVIAQLVAKKVLFTDNSVRYRAAASMYMFFAAYMSILAGLGSAIARLVVGFLSLLLSMVAVVFPATAPGLNNLIMLDAQYATYVGACCMYHNHNHPVLVCAADRLLQLGKMSRQRLEDGEKDDAARPVSNGFIRSMKLSRRLVILLLIKHPWLREHRKAALAAKKEPSTGEEEKVKDEGLQQKPQQTPQKTTKQVLPSVVAAGEVGEDELRLLDEIKRLEARANELRGRIPELRELSKDSKQSQDFVNKLLLCSGDAAALNPPARSVQPAGAHATAPDLEEGEVRRI